MAAGTGVRGVSAVASVTGFIQVLGYGSQISTFYGQGSGVVYPTGKALGRVVTSSENVDVVFIKPERNSLSVRTEL